MALHDIIRALVFFISAPLRGNDVLYKNQICEIPRFITVVRHTTVALVNATGKNSSVKPVTSTASRLRSSMVILTKSEYEKLRMSVNSCLINWPPF
jgi:hypothetical protein